MIHNIPVLKNKNLWQLIFNFLSEALHLPINPSPTLAIFGSTTGICLDNNTKSMISFSTLIARRLILCKWKDKSPPTFSHWIRDLTCYLVLEKIRYTVKGCSQMFSTLWQPVLTFMERMDPNIIVI